MSSDKNSDVRAGLGQLGASAWLRHLPWLRALHGSLPAGPRAWLSAALAARVFRAIRFAGLPELGDDEEIDLSLAATSQRHPGSEGVNIFGFFRGRFGLGESARSYTRALLAAGYPVALNDIGIESPQQLVVRSLGTHTAGDVPFAVNLIFVNPDFLDQAFAAIGRSRLQGRYTIACWFWELEIIPEQWQSALAQVDEIMVSSTFVERALKRVTDKPVFRVPLPIARVSDSGLTRADFGLSADKFIFMNSFDFNSSLHRKNPFAVVEAFRRAFPGGHEDVQLLVKCSNGDRHVEGLELLLRAAAADGRIMVRDGVIDRRHVHALQRCADSYISLHRAEGFGLGLAECMAMGKPVIATNWSGNLDFMTPENSCLVQYRLVPVEDGQYPHAAGASWADVDIDHAAGCMKRIVDDPAFAARIGQQAAVDIEVNFSQPQAAQLIISRLSAITAANEPFIDRDAAIHRNQGGLA